MSELRDRSTMSLLMVLYSSSIFRWLRWECGSRCSYTVHPQRRAGAGAVGQSGRSRCGQGFELYPQNTNKIEDVTNLYMHFCHQHPPENYLPYSSGLCDMFWDWFSWVRNSLLQYYLFNSVSPVATPSFDVSTELNFREFFFRLVAHGIKVPESIYRFIPLSVTVLPWHSLHL